MNYYIALLSIVASIGFTGLFLWFLRDRLQEKRKERFLHQELDSRYRIYLDKIPYYNHLSKKDKKEIEHSINLFIHTKEFIGVGITVESEMQTVIAFYACLLLLHIRTRNCYDNLTTILIYPSAVAIENIVQSGGIYSKEQFIIDGQAADNVVVLIWHDAKKEAYHLRHNNVIIHEFAHEIDFMDGVADGVPPLEKSKYDSWTRTLFKDYQQLKRIVTKNRAWDKYKLLGSYAATNEAEFFAVVTERFFESPKSLQKHFPELYNQLRDFYNIDTVKLLD